MKNTIWSRIRWGLALIFFGGIVPLGIDWAFKEPALFSILQVAWQVDDALSFYGSLLGAAATIFVLLRTIKFTVDNQKEERRLSIKPYLETTRYGYTNPLTIPDEQGVVYISLSKQGCAYRGTLPEDVVGVQKDHRDLQKRITVDSDEQAAFDSSVDKIGREKYHMLYEVTNCGAGNAVNVQFRIDKYEPLSSFCITTTQSKKFMLILNKNLLNNNDEYSINIRFVYDDIASLTHYCQHEIITFTLDKTGELKTFQKASSMLSKPIEIPQEAQNNG